MAEIGNSVTTGADIFTNIIQWITGLIVNLLSNIGMLEIAVLLIIGFIIFIFFNQDLLPQKVYKH